MKKYIYNRKLNHIKYLLVNSICLICILLSGCSVKTSAKEPVTESMVFFDTLISISIYSDNQSHAHDLIKNCFDKCNYFESVFDERNSQSEVSVLNNSCARPTPVSNDLASVIERSLYYSELSDGQFDITVYPVTNIWDFHEDSPRIPSNDEITTNLSYVNYKNITLDKKNYIVTLADTGTQIDVGGIAKGYIADSLADFLNNDINIYGAVINIGGEIRTVGTKPNGDSYTIGINDPFGGNTPVMALKISDKAIATSGTYERVITDNTGNTYHHILNPKTGYPAQTDLVSATIICDYAIDADTLCTICIIEGSSDAYKFIESLDNTEAILITNDNTIITTSGADKYIKH